MVSSLTKFLHYEVFKVHCFVCQAFGLLFKAVGFCEPYVILLSSTFIVNRYFPFFKLFFQNGILSLHAGVRMDNLTLCLWDHRLRWSICHSIDWG